MEDGSPARKSGGGGIDLLLLDGEVPIVGEVKAKTDTDFFYALVQALMYTIELSTGSQKDRLRRQYDNLPKNNFRFAVQVVFEDELESAKKDKLFNESCAIAEGLMQGDTLGAIIQEISFVKATLPETGGGTVCFEKVASYMGEDEID